MEENRAIQPIGIANSMTSQDMIFRLDCVPTAQQRPRHTRAKTGKDLTYKSDRQAANERELESFLAAHTPEKPLSGGVELCFVAIMPVPPTESQKRKEAMLRAKIGHTVKPDLDNLAKQLKDAMTRMRFWHDDRQVVRLIAEKVYGAEPCWLVGVKTICAGRQEK